ncbi:MAG TPA: YdcF family protein [Xanthobacteraceae bacterium]|jgi:uncharacterized SAM-binding protein YcdF (DUF218 family)|nr:YdcF family protein [Xanthobacteraceae bacterium]
MFFVLSKLLGVMVVPSNLVVEIGLVGIILLLTRFRRLASWLVVTSVVLTAFVGLSPLGNILILPLEDRFPPWDSSHGAPDGIVVLGGATIPEIAAARGDDSGLNEAAERITATVELARKYPDARIIFSGGNASLFENVPSEAAVAFRQMVAMGVAPDRITAEEQSRNTIENAVFSRLIAQPKPGEHWLLVTSAFHMPRAIAVFRAAGFPVEAYPVDYRTRGLSDATRLFSTVAFGLAQVDVAMHEWAGLVAYRLTGKTSEFFPAP